jgi:serine/alanine racemase
LGDSYYGIIKNSPALNHVYQIYTFFFNCTRNGLFFGFLFVSLGAYIAKYQNQIRFNLKLYLTALPLLLILLAAEEALLAEYYIARDLDMMVFLAPYTFVLFLILLNIKQKNHGIYIKLRKYSIVIYCSHCIFTTLPPILTTVGINLFSTDSLFRFILIATTTLLFSIAIVKLSSRMKILQKLY